MKPNYNYKYIAVSHTDHIIWGLGTTAEEAFRDAMGWMHDANPNADEYTDWDLFRESKSYDDLDLFGITKAALESAAHDEPNGSLTDWLYNNPDIVEVGEVRAIMTAAEREAYYAGADE